MNADTATGPKSRRFQRPKLSNLIADDLRHWIARDRLKPGERLPNERTLVEHYGCSKGTVREALKALEVGGLVKMQTGPNGGAQVQAVSIESSTQQLRTYLHFLDLDFQQVYAVRRTVEVTLAESVVGKLTEDQFQRMEDNVARCQKARAAGDRATARRLEVDFHDILCESCDNPFLVFICRFINGILRDLVEFRRDENDARDAFGKHNTQSHHDLIEAYRREDRAAVGKISAEHMNCAEGFMSRLDAAFRDNLLYFDGNA
ncbi:FadR/GntR family transcriptional regulator [Nitratireductor soli]|uniref:FadR/GntR family transcriptional regulator n=1 Tax=Nitratireductor soli TaxID=1670619 RepID=UPI00065DE61D|nr:FCD domain-containing protein [Nitratireductor soli]